MPQVHPIDIWEGFESEDPGEAYAEVRTVVPQMVADANPALIEEVGSLDDGVRRFIGRDRRDDTGQGHWRTLDGSTIDGIDSRISRERAKLALSQWMGVKTWELVQAFGLEALPAALRPPVGGLERGELRGWPTDGQSVWANAPHMTADDKRAFVGQSEVVGLYESSVWYQLQLTVNAAMRMEVDTRPMDWSYHHIHLVRLASESGQPQALRFVQSMLKAYQARNNGLGPAQLGFQLRFLHPWQLYSDDAGRTSFFEDLDGYDDGLRGRVLTGLVSGFLELVESQSEFALATWPRREADEYDNSTHAYWYALEPVDYVPTEYGGSGDVFEQPRYNHANAFYRLIPRLAATGIDETTLNRLIDWCARAWPNGDWAGVRP